MSRTAAEGTWVCPLMENQLRAQLKSTLLATADFSRGAVVATTSRWAVTAGRRVA